MGGNAPTTWYRMFVLVDQSSKKQLPRNQCWQWQIKSRMNIDTHDFSGLPWENVANESISTWDSRSNISARIWIFRDGFKTRFYSGNHNHIKLVRLLDHITSLEIYDIRVTVSVTSVLDLTVSASSEPKTSNGGESPILRIIKRIACPQHFQTL